VSGLNLGVSIHGLMFSIIGGLMPRGINMPCFMGRDSVGYWG